MQQKKRPEFPCFSYKSSGFGHFLTENLTYLSVRFAQNRRKDVVTICKIKGVNHNFTKDGLALFFKHKEVNF